MPVFDDKLTSFPIQLIEGRDAELITVDSAHVLLGISILYPKSYTVSMRALIENPSYNHYIASIKL
jgi:hypothetical protein